MDISVDLPSEIITELLARLPAKPLVKCKVIFKEWYGLISSKIFVKKHRAHMMKQNKVHVVLQPQNHFTPINYMPPVDGTLIQRFVNQGFRDVEYLCSCNGIVLVCSSDDELCLLNRTTGKRTPVPPEPIDFPPKIHRASTIFGLGYSETSDDYYVLRVSLFHSTIYSSEVKLFSRNSGHWVSLGPHPHERIMSGCGVYTKGCLHWRIYNEHLSVFNLDTYRFSLISIPGFIQQTSTYYRLYSLNNDKLVLIQPLYNPNQSVDIWILQNYPFPESWLNYQINLDVPIYNPRYISFQPLFLVETSRDKLFFWLNPIETFGFWDFTHRRFVYTYLQPVANVPASVFPFVESIE